MFGFSQKRTKSKKYPKFEGFFGYFGKIISIFDLYTVTVLLKPNIEFLDSSSIEFKQLKNLVRLGLIRTEPCSVPPLILHLLRESRSIIN